MDSSDIYYINILNNIIVYLYKYALPVVYVLGNIGNLLSALIFSKKSWRKNVCVFYFNICLLFNSCYINAYILGTIFVFGYNINVQNSNVILCKYLSKLIFKKYILRLSSVSMILQKFIIILFLILLSS
jgi:hypothetical protein